VTASSIDHIPINLLQVPIGGTVAAMLELSIKQGLARLKKLDIGQVQHLCQGCLNPTPPKRAGELILASDEQTFFCDLL
jgi:hypothetical protein